MNEHEKSFDSIFKKQGGLFKTNIYNSDEKYFLNNIKSNVDVILEFLKSGYSNLPEIYCNFIANPIINASVSKANNKYYLGINIGTYFLLADMFSKMFSNKFSFPEIGDINLESDDYNFISLINTTSGIAHSSEKLVFPKDKTRLNYAAHYTTLAFSFILMHEIGHILNGHIAFLSNKSENAMWHEYDKDVSSNNKIPFLNYQTLEMDADSFATNLSFKIGAFTVDNLDQLPESHGIYYKDFKTFLNHWYFSIYCFFRLFGFKSIDVNLAKNKSHPPYSIRLSMILSNMVYIISKMKPTESVKEIVDQLLHTSLAAEDIFTKVTFQENQFDIFKKNTVESLGYVDDIINNWKNVRPLLEPFSYIFLFD